MDDDGEALHRYGTPLEPLDEDEVLTKKPVTIEDQIVTDENGKRRFHGAFTGGFSAGFWNTVGSLEGWKPTSFKSSRNEKAPQRVSQKPEDFMDDEDLGEFGIAPQRIELTTEYQVGKQNRKFMQPAVHASGPIPGEPVLATLLQPPTKDKIAVCILKSMGWKPGQGIGPRLTAKEKKKARVRNKREEYILNKYADNENTVKQSLTVSKEDENEENDEDDDGDEITFAPDDYEPLICGFKTDRFGLGYTSIREKAANEEQNSKRLQHFNLFSALEVLDKHDKKLSIRGQAFGVGALEEEDDDIYARDDLSKYDFSLHDGIHKQKKAEKHVQDKQIIEKFSATRDALQHQPTFLVQLPNGFLPRDWTVRRTRFEPLAPNKVRELENSTMFRKRFLGRHDLDPHKRGAILDERQVASPPKPSPEEAQTQQRICNERTKELLERISTKCNNFTKGGIIGATGEKISAQNDDMKKNVQSEQHELLAKASEKTRNLGLVSDFKPFINNEAKQRRYEKFLETNYTEETEISQFLANIQPVELSEWDREMEKKEFIQARKIYKPLGGIMSDRFVSEAALVPENNKNEITNTQTLINTKKIKMERKTEKWNPHSLLCKRYNMAEPFGTSMEDADEHKPSKKAKLSIFDYLEASVNTKANFQTPVIIPKHIVKPKALVDNHQTHLESAEKNLKGKEIEKTLENEASLAITFGTVSEAQPRSKQPIKTELEKRVENTRDKPASEKVELFRAIFEDSDEEEEQLPTNDELAVKKVQNLELPSSSKTATAVNFLRNTSPPRGIFAALFGTTKQEVAAMQPNRVHEKAEVIKTKEGNIDKTKEPGNRITFKPRAVREQQQIEANLVDTYGPVLPNRNLTKQIESKVFHSLKTSVPSSTSALDASLLTLMDKHKTFKDVWIERKTSKDWDSGDTSNSNSSNTERKKIKKAKKSPKKDVKHKKIKFKHKKKKHN